MSRIASTPSSVVNSPVIRATEPSRPSAPAALSAPVQTAAAPVDSFEQKPRSAPALVLDPTRIQTGSTTANVNVQLGLGGVSADGTVTANRDTLQQSANGNITATSTQVNGQGNVQVGAGGLGGNLQVSVDRNSVTVNGNGVPVSSSQVSANGNVQVSGSGVTANGSVSANKDTLQQGANGDITATSTQVNGQGNVQVGAGGLSGNLQVSVDRNSTTVNGNGVPVSNSQVSANGNVQVSGSGVTANGSVNANKDTVQQRQDGSTVITSTQVNGQGSLQTGAGGLGGSLQVSVDRTSVVLGPDGKPVLSGNLYGDVKVNTGAQGTDFSGRLGGAVTNGTTTVSGEINVSNGGISLQGNAQHQIDNRTSVDGQVRVGQGGLDQATVGINREILTGIDLRVQHDVTTGQTSTKLQHTQRL